LPYCTFCRRYGHHQTSIPPITVYKISNRRGKENNKLSDKNELIKASGAEFEWSGDFKNIGLNLKKHVDYAVTVQGIQ
jgi:hypothetical protein